MITTFNFHSFVSNFPPSLHQFSRNFPINYILPLERIDLAIFTAASPPKKEQQNRLIKINFPTRVDISRYEIDTSRREKGNMYLIQHRYSIKAGKGKCMNMYVYLIHVSSFFHFFLHLAPRYSVESDERGRFSFSRDKRPLLKSLF